MALISTNSIIISSSPLLQSKTVNPALSQEVVRADAGYDGLESVTVNAMPSGAASVPATTIPANPTITVNSATGEITASVNASQSVSPSVTPGYVASGTAGTVIAFGSASEQLSTQAAQTITPTTTDQTIAAGKYLTGAQTIKGDQNLIAGNIKKNITIFNVTGSYEGSGGGGIDPSDATATANDILYPKTAYIADGSKATGTIQSLGAQTIYPSTSDQSIPAQKYLSGAQTIKAVLISQTLVAANIAQGVTIEIGDADDPDRIVSITGTLSGTQPTLNAPSISLSGSTLTIVDSANNGNFTAGYKIYDGATLIDTIQTSTYDLSQLSAGVHTITVKCYGTYFVDSVSSNAVIYDNDVWVIQTASDLEIFRVYYAAQNADVLGLE